MHCINWIDNDRILNIDDTWLVVCPVVDINVTDADHAPQVHPPRRCFCVVSWYHTLTTLWTTIIITSVYCFIRSPVLMPWPGMSFPNWLTKRNIFLKYLIGDLYKLHRNYNNNASAFFLYERHFKVSLPNPLTVSVLMNEYVTITNHILTDCLFLKKNHVDILLVYHIQIVQRVLRVSVSIRHKDQKELWAKMHEHVPTVFFNVKLYCLYWEIIFEKK